MRHISDGHEFRPRGGLLLVTTIHFYLYRYFPGAIDRARMHATESENRHAAKNCQPIKGQVTCMVQRDVHAYAN